MNKAKYILIKIIESVWFDIKSAYYSVSKPKEVEKMLFWLILIEIFTRRYVPALITIALYFIVYVWRIVLKVMEGYRHDLREEYKQRAKELNLK